MRSSFNSSSRSVRSSFELPEFEEERELPNETSDFSSHANTFDGKWKLPPGYHQEGEERLDVDKLNRLNDERIMELDKLDVPRGKRKTIEDLDKLDDRLFGFLDNERQSKDLTRGTYEFRRSTEEFDPSASINREMRNQFDNI